MIYDKVLLSRKQFIFASKICLIQRLLYSRIFMSSPTLSNLKIFTTRSLSPSFFSSSSTTKNGKPPVSSTEEPEFIAVSDLEWSGLSTQTQRVALLVWESRSRIPSGFLNTAPYKEQFEFALRIYVRGQSGQEGEVSASDPQNVLVQGIFCQKPLILKSDYVVEDPNNKGVALYLDTDGYRKLSNSCVSARKDLKVLFHPGSSRTKFPPRLVSDISTKWISSQKRRVFPFIATDLFSWACFIHPSIASRATLESTEPEDSSKNPLSPTQKITESTGCIVRCFSTLQSVIILHRLPAPLAWGILSIVLTFHHSWYYSSLAHSANLFKEAKRLTFKFLAGTPERVSQGVMLSIDKRGLPRLIPLFLRMLISSGDKAAIAATLFALDVAKCYVYVGSEKISTITDAPAIRKEDSALIDAWVPYVFDCLRLPPVKKDNYGGEMNDEEVQEHVTVLGLVKYFFTNKSGPNGHALLRSTFDAISLYKDIPVFRLFTEYCNIIGASNLPTMVARIAELGNVITEFISKITLTNFDIPILAKISRVYTANGKVRLVAIPPYFIQVIFRPIHLLVFSVLRLIPTDCTFDQESGVDRISKEGGDALKSYDLSAATDRLPLEVQTPVLECLARYVGFPEGKARRLSLLWAELIRSITFNLSSLRKNIKPRKLRYGTGHPMGTYSSWAVFTLCHHIIVQICAYCILLGGSSGIMPEVPVSEDQKDKFDVSGKARHRSQKTTIAGKGHFTPSGWYKSYQLLGDDIVLFCNDNFSEEVSEFYFWLVNLIGVKINPAKGFSSKNGSFEFAKRFVRRGIHLNNIYWGEWCITFNPFDAVQRVRTILSRGYRLPNPLDLFSSLVGLLPLCYHKKREVISWLLAPLEYPGKGKHKKLRTYLVALILASYLMLYKIDIRIWVRMLMKRHTLPNVLIPLGEYRSKDSCGFIRIILDRCSLLLKDFSNRSFSFRMNLPTTWLETFVSFYITRKTSVGIILRYNRGSPKESVIQALMDSVQVLALFLMSPACKVMGYLGIFSNSIIFPELLAFKKYKKSISLDPNDPYTVVEKFTSNDRTVRVRDPKTDSPESCLALMKVFACVIYAYELLHHAFNVAIVDDSLISSPDHLFLVPEIKDAIESAAARVLMWMDEISFARPRLEPLWTLPSPSESLRSFYGQVLVKQDVKRKSFRPTVRKPRMSTKEPDSSLCRLGTFTPAVRSIPMEQCQTVYKTMDIRGVENSVTKSILGPGWVIRLPLRD